MKKLADFYQSHIGKVSDKWSLYLNEYERLFSPYRERSISILEIGIQNGGSLEIWSQFFPNGLNFVGCDINPNCAKLTYEDSRIQVIVGDATTIETRNKVLSCSTGFDLIIEDGSHTSSDIVKAFAQYFPILRNGGLFVAEDLHCSYWQEYEGGIFHPYSSISFFKHLADIVNYEHWGIHVSRTQLLLGFQEQYQIQLDEKLLSEIHSIEFINSICVIRKSDANLNLLNDRVVAGQEEIVAGGHLDISGSKISVPQQVYNLFSNYLRPPQEHYQEVLEENNAYKAKLILEDLEKESLREAIRAEQAEKESLREAIRAEQAEKESLREAIRAEQAEKESLREEVNLLQRSKSWRYTAIFRQSGRLASFMVTTANQSKKINRYLHLLRKVFLLASSKGLGTIWKWINSFSRTSIQIKSDQAIDDYQRWIALNENFDKKAIRKFKEDIASFHHKPKISVVMPTYNPNKKWLINAIESVRNQIYPYWELCIADDASTDESIRPILEMYEKIDNRIRVVYRNDNGHISAASNSALELASGEWVAFLDHDDLLSEHALYWVADKINFDPNVRMIYSDEDKLDEFGSRILPYFKPDWSPHLILSQAYFGHLICYEKQLIDLAGRFDLDLNGAQDYGLALACSALIKSDQIQHISRILYHWRMHPESTALDADSKPYANEAGRKAVDKHIKKAYPNADLRAICGEHLFTYSVKFNLATELKVSIIIPTRDGLEFLKPCIESIVNKSTWRNFEIIVLDNGSEKPETIQYLSYLNQTNPCISVIQVPMPFNWSKLNNIGAQKATGDVFIFLNNDTQVISPSWIESLAGYAMLPDVGTVGALLLFDDFSIQHSGVVVGMGGWADHVFRTMAAQHSGAGPFVSPVITRNALAVTGACLAISREKFNSLGCFDESFVVCGSDVELGLRANKNRLFNVLCAEARLFHYESKTRSSFVPPEDFIQSNLKYAPYRNEKMDPYFNPNLSLKSTSPSLAFE